MRELTTGDDSTLGNYLKLTKAVFGVDSPATKFLEKEIEKSTNGENEEVIAAESQMLYLLAEKHKLNIN